MRWSVLIAAALVAGCTSSSPVVTEGSPVPSPYRGSLTVPGEVPLNSYKTFSLRQVSGSAYQAVECKTKPYGGGYGRYNDDHTSVQGSAVKALASYLNGEFAPRLPNTGYRIERDDGDHVLFSYDVDNRTKVAFIAASGVRNYDGKIGWGIKTMASCDPAELGIETAEGLGYQLWMDERGRPVPLSEVQSFRGDEHCNWQDVTFLLMGRSLKPGNHYLRNPTADLADFLRTTYQTDAELPVGATHTGFRRDDRVLWLGPRNEAAYLVAIDDPNDVERWPAAKDRIGCF